MHNRKGGYYMKVIGNRIVQAVLSTNRANNFQLKNTSRILYCLKIDSPIQLQTQININSMMNCQV